MIRNLHCICSIFRRAYETHQIHLGFGTTRVSISTNAAINNSLRRSQYDRRTSKATLPRGRTEYDAIPQRRPNQSRRSSFHDHEHGSNSGSNIISRPRSKPECGPKATVELPRSPERSSAVVRDRARHSLARDDTTKRTSEYDYSRKPGGNRAARGAARFGHKPDHGSDHELSPHSTSSFRRAVAPRNRIQFSASRQDTNIESTRVERTSRSGFLVPQDNANAPLSIPYTTPASEFLYGTSVVLSALHASRRKLYKLYVYQGDNRDARNQDTKIIKLADERDVRVDRVGGEWLRVMDKMSGGRPHNVRFMLALCLSNCSNS